WSDVSQSALSLSGQQTLSTGSSTRQLQGSFTYTPGQRLSFSANFGRVSTDGGPNNNSSARSLQLSARWAPSDKLSINVSRTTSESSGQRLSYGYGGYGGYSGYPGYGGYGGFSPGGYGGLYPGYSGYSGYAGYTGLGGLGTSQTDNEQPPSPPGGGSGGNNSTPSDQEQPTTQMTHYEDSSTSLNITYQPSSRLSFDVSLGSRTYKSDGTGYLADSDQSYQNISMMWQLSEALSLQTSYGRDTMRFLKENEGTVSNTMLNVGLNYRPPESRWGLGVMFTKQDGTSPTYIGFGRGQRKIDVATSLRDLSGRIYYRLGDTSDLFLQLGTAKFSGGYAAFEKQTAELGIERRLSDTARVTFGYRYIRNITDESGLLPAYAGVAMQAQDYIAKTLLLTFNMAFRGGGGGGQFRGPSAGMGFGGYGYGDYGEFGGYGYGSITTFGGYRSDMWARQRGWSGGGAADVFGSYGEGTWPFGSAGYGSRRYGYGPSLPSGPGGEWAGRGPSRPQAPGGETRGQDEFVPPDPWDAVGDGVSLW
ncbi:MAG: hypothetical protein H5T86_13555, partial [Armatimonadetes bacterium]|nr:hypothetical protein [Armatimonadota bacterium]